METEDGQAEVEEIQAGHKWKMAIKPLRGERQDYRNKQYETLKEHRKNDQKLHA